MLERSHRGIRRARALALAVALSPATAFAGVLPYELVFVAPMLPSVNEGSTLTVGIQLQLGCDPFSTITWQAIAEPGVGGTATANVDFLQPARVPLSFTGPNGRFVTFDVIIPDDLLVEGPETFDIRLTPVGAVDLDCFVPPVPPAAFEFTTTLTIIDNDTVPPPILDISDALVTEGDAGTQAASFAVTLTGAMVGPGVTVGYTTIDGSATAGSGDYQTASGQLTFPVGGPATQTITVLVNGDTLVEPDEMFTVRLTSPTGAVLGNSNGDGTILSDDNPPPALPVASIDSLRVEEGDGIGNPRAARFRVSLSEPSDFEVRLPYRTDDDSAIADQDYRPIQGTIVLPPGQTSFSFSVDIVGDLVPEPEEVFLVRLENPVGATLGPAIGRATIVDDDDQPTGLPTVTIDDVEVVEGNGGASGTQNAGFTVSLSAASVQSVRVPFQTADGTAVAGEDYQPRGGTLVFAPGETRQPIVVPIVGDTGFEPDETFSVRLEAPEGAVLERGLGTATIVNDDEPPPDLPLLRIDDVTVDEGDGGSRDALFTVSLDPASEVDVRLRAITRGGSATPGTDFGPVDVALTIPAGARTATVTVSVNGDTLVEDDETFFVMLREPEGAAIVDAEGRGLIIDDDMQVVEPPSIRIGDVRIQEGDQGAQSAIFRVRLSAPSVAPVRVNARTRDGTATVANQDYRERAEQLVIPPGQLEASFPVPVVGDRNIEPDERFGVELSNAVGATLADPAAVGTIVNDDQAAPTGFVRLLSTPPVAESDGRAAITVERLGDVSGPAQVTVVVAAGSAQIGDDFEAVRRRVRWAPGEGGTRQIAFAIRDDDVAEADETVAVSLAEPSGVALGEPARIDVVIVDNDTATRTEAIVDQQITSRARREVELSVRTLRSDGTPVPGAPVRWRLVSGTAELLGNPERRTDAEGITRLTVRLGRRPGKVVVAVKLIGRDAELAFAIRVEGDFGDLVDPASAPNDAELAGLLDTACTDETEGELAELCAFLFDLESDDERRRALQALRPDGAAALADQGIRGPRVQHRNLTARLRTLRGGQTQSTFNQLAVSLRGQSLTVGRVTRALSSPQGDRQWLARVDRRLATAASYQPGLSLASLPPGPARGGDHRPATVASFRADPALASEQRQAAPAADAPAEPFDTGSSRWGVFVNGRISIGDAPQTRRQAGYDVETEGLTAGVDYRLGERFVVGGAVGYLRSDSELGLGRGEIDVTGYSLSGYFTYYRERFYIDGIVNFGQNEYETSRVIVLPRAFRGTRRLLARANPDGDQLGANLGAGYDLLNGALSLQGFVRLAYTQADIDAYSEQGAGPLGLSFGAQEQDSLLSEAGLEVAYPFSFGWGVLQPGLRAAFLHEFADGGRDLRVGFQADAARRRYRNRTDAPDRSFFNIGLSLTATFIRGWAAYLQVDTDAARDDFDVQTFSFGVRKQL